MDKIHALNASSQNSFFSRARNLIVIFLVLALLMVSSALIELTQSKKEQLDLMREQAHTLLETLIISSYNSLLATEELENSYRTRLLNNATHVKKLFEQDIISNRVLQDIAESNNIFRINIYNKDGQRIFYNHEQEHQELKEKFSPQESLKPIFAGQTDTLIFGIRPARFEEGFRYAIAIASKGRTAIVLNVDASEIIEFRKEIGFGTLLRRVNNNPGIIYTVLQDTSAIIAAAGSVKKLEAVNGSYFLNKSLSDSSFETREIQFDSLSVFEAVHPFIYNKRVVGIFRIGLSMEPMKIINARVTRRLIIITVVLIVLGTIFLTAYFTRQRYDVLQHRYDFLETYSGNIIRNVNEAIIVAHDQDGIRIYNSAAEQLFGLAVANVIGEDISVLFPSSICDEIKALTSGIHSLDCNLRGQRKNILISHNIFRDSKNVENKIYVIRDLTMQKMLEEQVKRTERLTAMGELASGVAHEIRNPLNTIGTIAQQLDKDFEPSHDQEEFHELARLVFSEVKRINETVQDFLRFARPEPVQPQWFSLKELLRQLQKQYASVLDQQNITLTIKNTWPGKVYWDERQIKQVLINIIQNAIEAIGRKGLLNIDVKTASEQELELIIKDNGPGMKKELKDHIFDLYFTTKAGGTGIGLSIVQRIIYEHGGSIHVESEQGVGSTFIIRMPVKSSK